MKLKVKILLLLLVCNFNIKTLNATFVGFSERRQSSLNFNQEAVVPLYRGLHFCTDLFNHEAIINYLEQHAPGVNFLECDHVRKSIGNIRRLVPGVDIGESILRGQILNNAFMLSILRKPKQINGINLRNSYFESFHKDYSNLYSGDSYQAFLDKINKYSNTETQFLGNPRLSFSKNIIHPLKYSYGIKKYAGYTPLKASFSTDGTPTESIFGVLQVAFLRRNDLSALGVCDVNEDIGKPGHRIFNEEEVSLDGFLPPKNFVLDFKAKIPDLSDNGEENNILGITNVVRKHWLSEKYQKTNYIDKYLVQSYEKYINKAVEEIIRAQGCRLVTLEQLKS